VAIRVRTTRFPVALDVQADFADAHLWMPRRSLTPRPARPLGDILARDPGHPKRAAVDGAERGI